MGNAISDNFDSVKAKAGFAGQSAKKSLEPSPWPEKGQNAVRGTQCTILKWSPLDKQRLHFSVIECYKFVVSLNILLLQDYFELASKRTNSKFITIFSCN